MARSRILKPGFFSNEQLSELPFEHRLCFAGLWTLADRDGRLEDRPKRIKAALFPWDDVDMPAILASLAALGFIDRYSAGGVAIVQVVSFVKHQNPHHREQASELPVKTQSLGQAPTLVGPSTGKAGSSPAVSTSTSTSTSVVPPTPLQGAVVLAQANAAIRDADRVVQTADRVLTDPDVGDRAREFLEQYPVIFAAAKFGAPYRVKEARDFPTAIELVTQYPDPKHLTDMLRLFLLKKDWAPKNEPGSPRQFAFMAPQCDALLRESRRRA